MAHTPGPWSVGDKRGVWVGPVVMAKDGQRGVAFVCSESDANARLISAAPDLLDCCRELLEIVEDEYANDRYPEELGSWKRVIDAATRALNKAEGRG